MSRQRLELRKLRRSLKESKGDKEKKLPKAQVRLKKRDQRIMIGKSKGKKRGIRGIYPKRRDNPKIVSQEGWAQRGEKETPNPRDFLVVDRIANLSTELQGPRR